MVSALTMLEAGKAKAALWGGCAGCLVLMFSPQLLV